MQDNGGLEAEVSHALIGKYVFLHYLRDRGILSERKLEEWGLGEADVFGRRARLHKVADLIQRLDDWLNGSVFPLDLRGLEGPTQEHLERVAGTFAGDELQDDRAWQLHLDFRAYDFSYIPIETLSVVYEQFLHSPGKGQGTSKAKQSGAYYTPIPLVNFVLAEMEDLHPLGRGERVLDPSCGSGAFLVQCYRRLVERELLQEGSGSPHPSELRRLLQQQIFGIDRDTDACSVTELSLVLTLLDYVDPPDLERHPDFRLPALRGRNVFAADFFDEATLWRQVLAERSFDWIVGNPPWKRLNPEKLSPMDRPAWQWMIDNRRERPVGGNQLAQAFAWRVADLLTPNGQIGILVPGMTLFEDPSRHFHESFLRHMDLTVVANFANLAKILFAGRSRVPAAAFFYGLRPSPVPGADPDRHVRVYSPLVANQESTRSVEEHKRNKTWSLVVNASEVRDVPFEEIADGDGLPWKLAAWGSWRDSRLLRKLGRRFPLLRQLEGESLLVLAEGPQLKAEPVAEGSSRTEDCEEAVGQSVLDVTKVETLRHFFVFPDTAIRRNPGPHLRLRGGKKGLRVCRPPHAIVSAARNFAVYSDEFLIVPPRQIGIVSTTDDRRLLKALSLYLSSDFAFYHQFLTSTQFGIKRDVATLRALRQIPVPLLELGPVELETWVDLHARLVKASRHAFADLRFASGRLLDEEPGADDSMAPLLAELNQRVNEALGLTEREQALVSDLVRVRLELNDGKLGEPAVRPPTPDEMHAYATFLKAELDAFVGDALPKRHRVSVVFDGRSGVVEVDFTQGVDTAAAVQVTRADRAVVSALQKTRHFLQVQRSQWVYFNRDLRVYEGSRTYVLKPMQRVHWTRSQALGDASEIIAETLSGGEDAQ